MASETMICALREVREAAGVVAELELKLEAAKANLEAWKGTVRRLEAYNLNDQEKAIARGGDKIVAIKMVRERVVGLGLKEAKELVDEYLSTL